MAKKMLNKIYSFLRKGNASGAPQDKRVRKVAEFMDKNEMNFAGYGGLNIHRQVVREYGYLLRYITEGKLDTFQDFRAIRDSHVDIIKSIDQELAKPLLRESEVYGYSRQTAEGNLIRLKALIATITEYTNLCETLGINLYDPNSAGR
ncbi:hypothetical protein [Pseudomonas tolaasii]|uniref:hypothetical protein n=1 Tax=Pseudomonas tolaasii TaxID=29442 RepID=UPI001C528D26|nr:hypothetical protein [Pseudomonas tolaasii]QXQ20684.1 hypothetical protein I7845_09825 [Pseudomonas tolaasii]